MLGTGKGCDLAPGSCIFSPYKSCFSEPLKSNLDLIEEPIIHYGNVHGQLTQWPFGHDGKGRLASCTRAADAEPSRGSRWGALP